MSTIIHEDTLWPVAIIFASGSASLEQHTESLNQWNEWFARKETFCVLRVFKDTNSVQHSEEIGKLTMQWMKDGAMKNIQAYVGAMLIVVPEEMHDSSKTIDRVFGVPGGMFSSVESAYNFLQNVPHSNNIINGVSQQDIDAIITKVGG